MGFFDKYELYTEGESVYCYAGTGVLKNKLNIREIGELRNAEDEFVSARMIELEINPIKGAFDKQHLCAIHAYIFGDCYDFAGQTRKEDISKGDTKFCVSGYIDDQLTDLFERAKKFAVKLDDSREDKIAFFTYLMTELNIIHPFREGNGRAIREFVREYAVTLNLRVHWNAVDKERLLNAMIASVTDSTALKDCMNEIIK